MTIEIHRPELEALIMQRMKSGGFHDVETVLMQALKASPPAATFGVLPMIAYALLAAVIRKRPRT